MENIKTIINNYSGQTALTKSTLKFYEEVQTLHKETEKLNVKFNAEIDIDADIDSQAEGKYKAKMEAEKNLVIAIAKEQKLKKMIAGDLQTHVKELDKNLAALRKNIPSLIAEKESILKKLEECENRITAEQKRESYIINSVSWARDNIQRMTEVKKQEEPESRVESISIELRPIQIDGMKTKVKPVNHIVNGVREVNRFEAMVD